MHIDKVSDLESGWKLKFGKVLVAVDVPERIHLTMLKQGAREPHGFTQYARKHLRGKVTRIYQPGFDRVVAFEFDSGQKLIFELFSKGNAVLVNAESVTEKAIRDEEWKDRIIKRGKEYKFPVSGKLDPREMSEKEFNALFGEKDVIHSLVSGINMSGKYLEEACEKAGVDKNSNKPGKKLFKAIKNLLEENRGMSAKLDEQYGTIDANTAGSDKVSRKMKQQENAVIALEEKAKLEKSRGDAIYANWKELEGMVSNVKSLREQGKSYDEINEMLAGKASINKKTKRMSVKM